MPPHDHNRMLEEKEAEVAQSCKRIAALQSENATQEKKLEELGSELAQAHQELKTMSTQWEDKGQVLLTKICADPKWLGLNF